MPSFLPRMGQVPLLLGLPERGHVVRGSGTENNIIPSEELWLPISGQLARRLSLFPRMFGIFVTLKISVAAVYIHTGCALHDSRGRHLHKPSGEWSSRFVQCAGPGMLGRE